MRRIVKRLLRKYDYPPEGQEDALSTIMKQCDMWSENS
jgi:type I restriction enzyme R subunit